MLWVCAAALAFRLESPLLILWRLCIFCGVPFLPFPKPEGQIHKNLWYVWRVCRPQEVWDFTSLGSTGVLPGLVWLSAHHSLDLPAKNVSLKEYLDHFGLLTCLEGIFISWYEKTQPKSGHHHPPGLGPWTVSEQRKLSEQWAYMHSVISALDCGYNVTSLLWWTVGRNCELK